MYSIRQKYENKLIFNIQTLKKKQQSPIEKRLDFCPQSEINQGSFV